jgi:hypothetical protein
MGKTFRDWYNGGGDKKLSRERKERYANDPVYRQTVIDRAKAQRDKRVSEPPPLGYDFTMAEAAEHVGVTIWTLREWRKKNYFPEPMDYKGKKLFTNGQLTLLGKIKDFLTSCGTRMSKSHKEQLDNVVGLIYSNWS